MDKHDAASKLLHGQAQIWKQMFAFVDSMALKCAVELQIADIIHSHGRPLSLSEISSNITNSSSPSFPYLARIMRLLVRNNIFESIEDVQQENGGDTPSTTLYGLTTASRWLLNNNDQLSMTPFILMENHPWLLSPWHQLSTCVREGGIAFQKAHGKEIWDMASQNPEFNKIFNDGMECTGKITMQAILSVFKGTYWDGVESLVDVGGGTGATMAEIVKVYPHIKGINFDLPHVIATAPKYDGVSHVGGDMFDAIPSAQAVFMKWIMHDWCDEDCVKILKNCRRAIPEKTGKVFIVEVVLKPDGDGLFDSIGMILDLLMIAHSSGGKERTEPEWKKLLDKGGFPRYKITEIPACFSIIEAYPE
ncbi:xanthohumol 4-O-methyltransferase-like [Coffea eugenioides]|uniref:Xanthohumol 4-O-methyltransferase-like n=1 Tax=Coffea arabica TaxID=13443 RepID=A0A6P6TU03_COFAR|nr:xanthohumol 4-O-methyltransferase-like [Coffea arabica]XP_027183148.1 xanthohumol 4-O-methyltransferase-like [Coffea eugenioides]